MDDFDAVIGTPEAMLFSLQVAFVALVVLVALVALDVNGLSCFSGVVIETALYPLRFISTALWILPYFCADFEPN
ncbi:hypothetical protein KJI95_16120 [Shewanella sp. JM162201]|uniref:Uncharacterized protein n=1 Tax=Shewanella jiangmenensis TaxID=2837387 RepID=A0ABS5V6E8_9GAMM|nr:hypothetical protein [Shewanella jiangmenensis]